MGASLGYMASVTQSKHCPLSPDLCGKRPLEQNALMRALGECWQYTPSRPQLVERALEVEALCARTPELESPYRPPQVPASELLALSWHRATAITLLSRHWGRNESGMIHQLPREVWERILTAALPIEPGVIFAEPLGRVAELPLEDQCLWQLSLTHATPAPGKCTLAVHERLNKEHVLARCCVDAAQPPALEVIRVILRAILMPLYKPVTQELGKGNQLYRPEFLCYSNPEVVQQLRGLLEYVGIELVPHWPRWLRAMPKLGGMPLGP